MPAKKTNPTASNVTNEEIYSAIISLQPKLAAIEVLEQRQNDQEKTLNEHSELMNGNGKPGFKSIRDKVLSWENKINAVTLLILGDVVLRLYQLAAR